MGGVGVRGVYFTWHSECLNWWLLDLLSYKPGMFWAGAAEVVDGAIVG